MGRYYYAAARVITRVVGIQTMKITTLHADRFDRSGGFVVACTHLSHLEPVVISGLMRRPIDWMARTEFYRSKILTLIMNAMDVFPVKRRGVTAQSIRTAINRIGKGRIVGIFPEGGVVAGKESVMAGGPIKLGACVISQWAKAPILPVAVLGTPQLIRVRPWIPFPRRQIKLWVILGEPIFPPENPPSRRQARFEMGEQLRKSFIALHEEMVQTCNIPPEHRP